MLRFRAARYYPSRRFACHNKLTALGINTDIANEAMIKFTK